MQTHVTRQMDGDLAYLTFDCDEPGKPPTLDYTVLDELERHLRDLAASSDIRLLVLRSASPKYFVVGANINALKTLDAASIVPWVLRGHGVFRQIEALPLPVVAVVGGYALGGGLELAMACDIIVATTGARFGQPEARLGLVAGWGGCYRLPRRIGQARAKEMLFSGKVVEASVAQLFGLVSFVGDVAAVDAWLAAFAADLRQGSRLAVAEMKQLANASLDCNVDLAEANEASASARCMADADTMTRIGAFLNRVKPASAKPDSSH